VASLSSKNFRNRNPLVLGLVREHRSRDHVADRIDAWHVGRVAMIDLDAAAIVEPDA
jgi:hypothetical protein